MSKFTTTLRALMAVGAVCVCESAGAQVMLGYGLSVEQQTYEALESPTVIVQGSTETESVSAKAWFNGEVITETSEVSGYPIGFSFKYGNLTATGFGVAGNGYLVFTGDEPVNFDPEAEKDCFTYFSDCDNVCGLVVNYVDLGENSVIGYSVSGEEGDRVLSVEFSNVLVTPKNWSWNSYPSKEVSLMYKVYEKDNSITVTFQDWNGFTEGTGSGYLGLKQTEGNAIFVKPGESWSDATTSNSTSNLNFGVDDPVENGFTFKWSYPDPCVAPLAQPASLKLYPGSDFVEGEFAAPDAKVDNYLVVLTKGAEQTFVPVNGTQYAKDEEVEGSTIVYWGYNTQFSYEDLDANTQYTVSVYSANSIGSNGPVYLTESPLQQTFYTAPDGPTFLGAEGSTTSSITFSVEAVEGFDVIVLMTDEVKDTGLGRNREPYFGVPSGNMEVGDYVPDTRARVVYKGGSSENICVEDLASGTGWYLEALSVTADGTLYSTDMLDLQISTVGTMPYVQDFNNVVYPELPVGWTSSYNSEMGADWFGLSMEEEETVGEGEEAITNTYRCIQALGFEGSEEEPGVVEFTTIPVTINQMNGQVALQWAWNLGSGFAWFAKYTPITFTEGDELKLSVSEDGAEWTSVTTVNSNNAPAAIEDPVNGTKYWNNMTADLSDYVGKTVYFKFSCTTVQSGAGNRLYVRDFSVQGVPLPEVPEVRVEDKGVDYAILVWRGAQSKYELEWGLADSDELSTVTVESKTYTLENLEGATSYQARVRGYDAEYDCWSDWSEVITFTTNDWPVVSAPEGLTSVVDGTSVTLSWQPVADVVSYEVRYRKGSSTVWNTVSDLVETSVNVEDLEENTTYLWSVRANCTHDRQTVWATQQEFSTTVTGISSVLMDSAAVKYYSVDGRYLGNDSKRLPKGAIVIATDGTKYVKTLVK